MRFYRTILWKAYFDKGMNLTSYVKYIIAFFGLASQDLKTTMFIAIGYAFFCLILGRLWFHFKLIESEIEVGNQFNPFVKEMRKVYKDNNHK